MMRWSGFSGGPGYSAFYFSIDGGFWDGGLLGDEAEDAASDAAGRVSDAFIEILDNLPEDVSLTIENECLIINSDTGEIMGAVDIPTPNMASTRGTGGYSGPSGAVVNWRTNDYRNGRRIRGRTFLVPLSGSSYESDGTLSPSALSNLRAFGEDMIGGGSGPQLGVWSRPVGGSGGVFASVVGSSVPDLAAVLRSRRD